MSCKNYNIELCYYCSIDDETRECWIAHFKKHLNIKISNDNYHNKRLINYINYCLPIIDNHYIYFEFAANTINPKIMNIYETIKLLK